MEDIDLSTFGSVVELMSEITIDEKDMDKVFLEFMRSLPYNQKILGSYNPIPNVILSEYLLDNIERLLVVSETDTKLLHNNAFEKFYNEVLKSTFEDMLKIRAPMLDSDFPQGTFRNSNYKSILNDIQIKNMLKLPVFKYTDKILDAVENNTFVLINGETGSGKTTQIPQFILDHHMNRGSYCRIICTQPRRISAISIAERVAYERGENLGESVGYQIRLESVLPRPADSILYCTSGVLLRMMISDPILATVSHVILDEIHERDTESDLLIGLIQLIIKYNKQIKVLVMSATFGFEEYSKNFSNFKIINIEGTLHPVKNFYLEEILRDLNFFDFPDAGTYESRKHSNFYNTPEGRAELTRNKEFKQMIKRYTESIEGKYPYTVLKTLENPFTEEINLDLIERLIVHVDKTMPDGAILIFLPSFEKISNLHEMLEFTNKNEHYIIYTLHSSMPTDKQKGIFDRPPEGKRKIILATNIAETSITIDDIVYVINAGKAKVKYYDIKNKIETLEEYWITKANATQRQGRAGRCQPGICFNLYTKIREENFEEYPVPTIQRTRMESVIMWLKSLKIHDVKAFLNSLISSPRNETIDDGINFLKQINALDKDEVMTPLGLHLMQLPIDSQVGKMLLLSTIFGCVDPITTVAATISLKEPFSQNIKKRKEFDDTKLEFAEHSRSDHITYSNVVKEFRSALKKKETDKFCYENFVSESIVMQIEKMKIQLCELLASTGFIKYPFPNHSEINQSSADLNIVRAVITAGLYPNIAFLRSIAFRNMKNSYEKRIEHVLQTPEDGNNVKFHVTSVNRKQSEFNSKFFVYYNKHKSGNYVYLRESSMISPIAIIIFSDNVTIKSDGMEIFIYVRNNTLRFPSNKRTVNVLLQLRERFEKILEKLAMNPAYEFTGDDKKVIEALKLLFIEENY
ncbi:ATP-dependent DNA/RNA helicase DHX36-like [Condylostylus longicornis]|uniref:ATP-dependent DNA/RNA helicase DHX36-like n=1 Tax=Condylostylus longicornis TaxID=2530218 RepID=UPI00244E12C1|nr:ATP-dependent DNA/RNA helicase DHX36-like [Condylostylus longicornis]